MNDVLNTLLEGDPSRLIKGLPSSSSVSALLLADLLGLWQPFPDLRSFISWQNDLQIKKRDQTDISYSVIVGRMGLHEFEPAGFLAGFHPLPHLLSLPRIVAGLAREEI